MQSTTSLRRCPFATSTEQRRGGVATCRRLQHFRYERNMRFARLHGAHEGLPAGIEEFAAGCELDMLQLDYLRPRQAIVTGDRPVELPPFALGFCDALRKLTGPLFLEPQFHVIASAGWESAYECVERAAGVLVGGGCGDIPVAAIRGSNLLPILELLQADRLELRHADTGQPLRELREPLLAADLQIGAGPIATALAEDARVLVGGCFDPAAPAIAMAATHFHWEWNDLNRLAAAALAAHAAQWSDWDAIDAQGEAASSGNVSQIPQVEIDAAGQTTFHAVRTDEDAIRRFQHWLGSHRGNGDAAKHADVRLDLSSIRCSASGPRQMAIAGATGAPTDKSWRLEILYQTGYSVEFMVEFVAAADDRLRRQIVDVIRSQLAPDEPAGQLTVQELHPAPTEGGMGWLHVAFASKHRRACQHLLDHAVSLASSRRQLLRLASGPLAVHAQCGLWPTSVPRDAIDIAIETRPAKEWQ